MSKIENDKSNQLIEGLRENPFLLAPMAGITDTAFRSYMKRLGAGVLTTELVSANGLHYQSEKTFRLMEFSEAQRPIGIQLFGETAEALAAAAQLAEKKGADFVDLNFGCPVKKVVSKGAGSAVLKDLSQLTQILKKVKSSLQIPLTIKIRTGWDHNTRNADEVAHIAYNEGVTWVAIHGRTRAQGYSGLADWEYIGNVSARAALPIIGNGDITSPEMAVERLRSLSLAGVMIGRGCLRNPMLFLQSLDLLRGKSQSFSEHVVFIQIRKFAGWYSHGFVNSSQFRKALFEVKTLPELMERVLLFFSQVTKERTSGSENEPFLMGGHG
jgi:nifR3 family TIM-barrel protein